MTIMYIGYWGANEGLSQATIRPHLEILDQLGVEKIVYISIERTNETQFNLPSIDSLEHRPIYTNKYSSRLLNKLYDFLILPEKLLTIARQARVDKIICRTSLAGMFGHYIAKRLQKPYYVESFEPHANYMIETGNWKKWGLSAFLEKRWERQQLRSAEMIMPVSYGYKKRLVQDGWSESKISVMPCCVDIEKFKFSQNSRDFIRSKEGFNEKDTIGIYVGKFEDIYFSRDEACDLFKQSNESIENFGLIILTPEDPEPIIKTLTGKGLNRDQICVKLVAHEDIPNYLSASDFAYSLISPTPSIRYCSPIKNGEYWANGLPIIISEGIGDDSEIVKENGNGGIITGSEDIGWSLKRSLTIEILEFRNKNVSTELAFRHRNFDQVRNIYQYCIHDASTN